jgi:hypothetical protein
MKMTAEETLLIERECERRVVEAVYCADRQDCAGLAALFTAEGTLGRPGGGAPLAARQARFLLHT